MDDDRGVEQAALGLHRRADHDHRKQVLAGTDHLVQRSGHGIAQRLLVKQVLTGVGREAQLGKDHKRRVLRVRALSQLHGAGPVEPRVADADPRNRRRDAHEAVRIRGVKGGPAGRVDCSHAFSIACSAPKAGRGRPRSLRTAGEGRSTVRRSVAAAPHARRAVGVVVR